MISETMISAIKMGVGIGPLPTEYAVKGNNLFACFELPPETRNNCWLLMSPATKNRRTEVNQLSVHFSHPDIARYSKRNEQSKKTKKWRG